MSAMIPVSVIVLTRNEERNIAHCLASVTRFGEVFVVDSQSTDRTCEIARKEGAKVAQFSWNGRYPKKKQWCLLHLPFTFDWVLYLDADERVSRAGAEEIARILDGKPRHDGYFASLEYAFLGRSLRHGHRIRKLVLFNRHRGRFAEWDDLDVAQMWEVEGHYQPTITGSVGRLRHPILHEDEDDLYHYFDRHNRYSDWEAAMRHRGRLGTETNLRIHGALKSAFNVAPARGLLAFIWSYVVKRGFLDGRAGLHFALARAFYYWQIGIKVKERRFQRR